MLYIPEDIPEVEKIRIAINSLPDTLKDEARVEVCTMEERKRGGRCNVTHTPTHTHTHTHIHTYIHTYTHTVHVFIRLWRTRVVLWTMTLEFASP